MSAETAFINRVLARHGARPDLRLWRNASAAAYVGHVVGRAREAATVRIQPGDLILRGGRQIQAGLCPGSSDLIGIGPDGRFVGLELKTENVRVEPHQERWLELVRSLGGIGAVIREPEQVDALLGAPPARARRRA